MKKIPFDQPRYIVPLIITPFVFIIFHLNRGFFASSAPSEEVSILDQTEEINPDMPSANLDRKDIQSKFNNFKDRFGKRDDFTAMLGLEDEGLDEEVVESLYSDEEKRLIDSLNAAIMDGKNRDFMTSVNQKGYRPETKRRSTAARETETEYDREMRMFREQMTILDSLTKSPEQLEAERLAALQKEQEQEAFGQRNLANVRKVGSNPMADHFNTISVKPSKLPIQAILDEEIKVQDGSRVRIRLMDAIEVDDYLVEKGTYLFGTVQSFSDQRVNIQVTSLLIDEKILPVELTVHDNDGMPGLYVPNSNFREFSRDLAGNVGGNNIQIEQDPQNTNQLVYGMAQRAMQTSTRAIRKAARRNKAQLKYNTIVYLVGSDDQQN